MIVLLSETKGNFKEILLKAGATEPESHSENLMSRKSININLKILF